MTGTGKMNLIPITIFIIPFPLNYAPASTAGGKVLKHTLSSNADNGADKGNSSSEENPSVHRST